MALAAITLALLAGQICKAEVDMCYSTNGALETSCNTSGQLQTEIMSGTVTTVTTVGTITNVVHVDDNSSSLTVDGTVTAVASGTQTVTATDFDIRDLTAASDTVTVTGAVTANPTALTTWEYATATVTTGATATLTITSSSKVIVCNSCGGIVNVRFDGTDPTINTGMPLFSNSCMNIEEAALTTIEFYNRHTSSCELYVQARR